MILQWYMYLSIVDTLGQCRSSLFSGEYPHYYYEVETYGNVLIKEVSLSVERFHYVIILY